MSHPGIGAMLHSIKGGSDENPGKYYGRKVVAADIDEERLLLTFEDGVKIKIWDDGQSCDEHRYITCDDNVACLVGGTLMKIEAKGGGEEEDEYGEAHEWCFVDVITTKGFITMTTHNEEHNGYYGGFGLSVTEVQEEV